MYVSVKYTPVSALGARRQCSIPGAGVPGSCGQTRVGMGTNSGPLEGQQALTTTISPALKLIFIAP